MYIPDRQLHTPGFEADVFVSLAEYQNLPIVSVYEGFIKTLTAAIQENEEVLMIRSQAEKWFRRLNIGAICCLFLPIGMLIGMYTIAMRIGG